MELNERKALRNELCNIITEDAKERVIDISDTTIGEYLDLYENDMSTSRLESIVEILESVRSKNERIEKLITIIESRDESFDIFDEYISEMATLSRWGKIIVTMRKEDGGKHHGAHVHVRYNEHEISISITGQIYDGSLPSAQLSQVMEWISQHQDELKEAWDSICRGENPKKIKPYM